MNTLRKKTHNIWRLLNDHISDIALREIAKADYDYSVEEHYQALRQILDEGQLPSELKWEPREVLSLCRWQKYDGDEAACLSVFFCSFCLIAAGKSAESAKMLDGQIDNLIIAIDTACQMEGEWLREFYRYLIDLLPDITIEVHDDDYLYYHLAIYLTSCILQRPLDERESLLEQVIAAEKQIQTYWQHAQTAPLEDILNYSCFDMRHDLWRTYLEQFGVELERKRHHEFGPFSA